LVTKLQTLRRTVERHPLARNILLGCGVASSVLWVATDIVASLRYEGYSYMDQTFSELSAVDAPTRSLMVAELIACELLVIAFGVGVWGAAGRRRALRVVAGLLVAGGIVNLAGIFTPMHQREVLAAGGGTLTDTLHIVLGATDSVLFLLIVGFGAAAFGKRFRLYSIGTILLLLVFGALTGLEGPRLSSNESTPWLGVFERTSAYAFMLWVVLLAGTMLRVGARSAPRPLGRPAVTLQMLPR
jgi:hypothetical membrane protein